MTEIEHPHHVYLISDAKLMPVYVGVSSDDGERAVSHLKPKSGLRVRLAEVGRDENCELQSEIVARFPSRIEAEFHETGLILAYKRTETLLNRTHGIGRYRSYYFEQLQKLTLMGDLGVTLARDLLLERHYEIVDYAMRNHTSLEGAEGEIESRRGVRRKIRWKNIDKTPLHISEFDALTKFADKNDLKMEVAVRELIREGLRAMGEKIDTSVLLREEA
jgi:hypothetical protein